MKAIRDFLAPTAMTPAVGCTLGSPKSGFLAGFVAMSARMPSNCPRRMVSRFCRSGARCGGLVEIHRNLIALPDLGADVARHGDTILDARALDRNEGNHVGRTHARMRALVSVQIDQLGGLAHATNRRFLNRLALPHQRDHAAVMVGVHLAIEQVHAVHPHGRNNGVHLGFIAALGEIGYTFNQCRHKAGSIAGEVRHSQATRSPERSPRRAGRRARRVHQKRKPKRIGMYSVGPWVSMLS